MALNINGTTGISGVDGSASAPALQGTDSNTGINFGSDTVNINTSGTTRATVNSSGNLGLGTDSPTARFDVRRDDTDGKIAEFHQSGGFGIDIGSSQSAAYISSGYGQAFVFKTDPSSGQTERMRINGDGNIFMGTTVTNPGFGSNSDPGNFFAHTGYAMHSRNSGTALFIARNDSTGSLVSFNYNGGGQIADITTNGSSVSYGTGSDYRLKENITNLTNAITRLKNLKPSRFNFLTTPSITQDGFIAHEVQEVVPEAVTGVKDEVRTEDGDMGQKKGDPVMQSLDVAKLVPLLTAALQEAVAKIEVLETKVAALEAA